MIPKIKLKKKIEQAKYPTRSRGIIVKYSKRGLRHVSFPLTLFRIKLQTLIQSWLKPVTSHLTRLRYFISVESLVG